MKEEDDETEKRKISGSSPSIQRPNSCYSFTLRIKFSVCSVQSVDFQFLPKRRKMVATGSSMAAAAVLIPRLSSKSAGSSASPFLPPCPISSFSPASIRLSSESRGRSRSSMLKIRASYSDESSPVDTSEIFNNLKAKWDGVENKSTVLLYGGGAIVAVWLSSIIVGAINSVPLFPKIMELVGLGYSGWLVYRYLLFKSSRKELAAEIETLKKKIAGTE